MNTITQYQNNLRLLSTQSIKIGIFDSGIGGISILQQLIQLPGLELFYAADTAHVPYGKRSNQEIKDLSHTIIEFLVLQQHVELIIIACHTVSAIALDYLKEQFPSIKFIGMVDLVIEQATKITQSGRIGIIATKATISSKIHKKRILELNQHLQVFDQACPRLASTIEKDYANSTKITTLLHHYLRFLLKNNIDTLILGCTHYALIKNNIQNAIGPNIILISADQTITTAINPLISPLLSASTIQWFVTGNCTLFKNTITSLLPTKNEPINKIKKPLFKTRL